VISSAEVSAGLLFALLFIPEDGSDMFLRSDEFPYTPEDSRDLNNVRI
jgi:hypothetical protein